jgi:enoyl-CoA hydratase/carnithine racemase
VSYPAPKVLQLRLNRPEQLNAMTDEVRSLHVRFRAQSLGALADVLALLALHPKLETDLCTVLDWFEQENSLWVVVVTGTGRAFCAGQGEPPRSAF